MLRRFVAGGILAALPLQVAAVKRDAPTSFGPLKFTKNGTFHINILEDLHFGNGTKVPTAPLIVR